MMTSFAILLVLVLFSSQSHSANLIESVNNARSTWTAGENFPEDIPNEYLKRLNGAFGRPLDPNLETKTYKITKNQIPATFDARDNWPQCADMISHVRDQGACGSCWAFAAAEVMSDRLCIGSGGNTKFNFSVQDLLECCVDCIANSTDTCLGGYEHEALNYWLREGIPSGGDHVSKTGCKPYSASTYLDGKGPKTCQKACQSSYQTSYKDDKKLAKHVYVVNSTDIQQMQVEIMTNGPVTVSYRVYEDFYYYKNGVYQHVIGRFTGYHAIKIIGWGSETVNNQTIPYWLAANSWGADWGDLNGFFKILRGENHCGIEDWVLGGISSSVIPLPTFALIVGMITVIVNLNYLH